MKAMQISRIMLSGEFKAWLLEAVREVSRGNEPYYLYFNTRTRELSAEYDERNKDLVCVSNGVKDYYIFALSGGGLALRDMLTDLVERRVWRLYGKPRLE